MISPDMYASMTNCVAAATTSGFEAVVGQSADIIFVVGRTNVCPEAGCAIGSCYHSSHQ